MNLTRIINNSIDYVERNNYKSYDLFDALTNQFLEKLFKGKPLLRRIAIQLNAKSPFNFRFIGMKKMVHTKTISDMLSVYSLLFKKYNDNRYLIKADNMYKLLKSIKIDLKNGSGWGLNFPYTTRFVDASVDTPNLYNTINCIISLLNYYEISSQNHVYDLINAGIDFIIQDLGIIFGENNESWIRYYPEQSHPIFNVNALSVSAFCRVNSVFKEEIVSSSLISMIIKNLIDNQNKNGSWYYALSDKGKWVDGFHNGFILESLAHIYHLEKNKYDIYDTLIKGIKYFQEELFTKNSFPKYFPSKKYPVESQTCAQAIQTLANCSYYLNLDNQKILDQVIQNVLLTLYHQKGYFFYKKGKLLKNKQVYFRWSQTPIILSLIYAKEYLDK